MEKQGRLLERARTAPQGLSFVEFETLLDACGWRLKRQKGSHRIWASPHGRLVPIQPTGGKAKAYQVKEFLRVYDEQTDQEG